MNVCLRGDLLSLKKFRWYFLFSSCLCIIHIKVNKDSAACLIKYLNHSVYKRA